MGQRRSMHWTHDLDDPIVRGRRCAMSRHDVFPQEILRYGAYVCLGRSAGDDLRAAPVPALAQRLGLTNEFAAAEPLPAAAIAFLRRVGGTPGAVVDDDVLHADAVIHV